MGENPQLFVFGEGKTEEKIFSKIVPDPNIKLIPVGGKNKFNENMGNVLSSEFSPGDPSQVIRVLVFCDLDAGEKETEIKNKFERIAKRLTKRNRLNFKKHASFANVFVLVSPSDGTKPGLRMVLHLANPSNSHGLELVNQTSDGYILSLALKDEIIQRFAKDIHIDSGKVLNKVVKEVPDLLKGNGIKLDQDKDYLGVFLAVTRFWRKKRTEDQQLLAGVILDRAKKYADEYFNAVMQSWQVAFQEAQK